MYVRNDVRWPDAKYVVCWSYSFFGHDPKIMQFGFARDIIGYIIIPVFFDNKEDAQPLLDMIKKENYYTGGKHKNYGRV